MAPYTLVTSPYRSVHRATPHGRQRRLAHQVLPQPVEVGPFDQVFHVCIGTWWTPWLIMHGLLIEYRRRMWMDSDAFRHSEHAAGELDRPPFGGDHRDRLVPPLGGCPP